MLGIIGAMDVQVISIKIENYENVRNQEHCRKWYFYKRAPLAGKRK